MKKLIALTVVAISLASSAANIVLIGDSTLAPRAETVKLGSWGDALKPSLAPGNGIINRAVGGRTVRSTKPGWAKSLALISKGDFVIIQFGINDASPNPKKLVGADEFKKTLAKFADDVLAKGATPVICSPVANAGYGKIPKTGATFSLTKSRRTYGDYAKAVAAEKKLDYVDMTALTAAALSKLDREAALALYVGETKKKDGASTFDTTHPAKAGAKRFAELFIADVKARKLPVAKLFK